MVTGLMNSEKPRPALQRHVGGARNQEPIRRKGNGSLAITVQGGVARPGLYAVGSTRPAIEVPEQIDVEALAAALNAQLHGAAPTSEVDMFYLLLAGAYGQGMEDQRNLAEVS